MKNKKNINVTLLGTFFCFIGCGGENTLSASNTSNSLDTKIQTVNTPNANVQTGSAFIVLYAWNPQDNEYQVLMGHDRFSNRDYWNLCGGKIDNKEDPKVAICRETYEESVRWYGSHPSKNLKGKKESFSPNDLSDFFSFTKNSNKKTYTHYFYFKEVSYLDPKIITESLSEETDHNFKENDGYGWLSWKTFAYHAIKEYYNPGYSTKGIHEKMKKSQINKTLCRDFTWIPFRELQGANYVLQITNKELFKQRLPNINTLSELNNYLNNYYHQKRM